MPSWHKTRDGQASNPQTGADAGTGATRVRAADLAQFRAVATR